MKRTTVTPEWMGEVRKRTKVNNMTSRDLAAACGWSESVVRKYINGLYYNDNPHADILLRNSSLGLTPTLQIGKKSATVSSALWTMRSAVCRC